MIDEDERWELAEAAEMAADAMDEMQVSRDAWREVARKLAAQLMTVQGAGHSAACEPIIAALAEFRELDANGGHS